MTALKFVTEASHENRHQADLESVIVHEGHVYTSADDGKVKVWNKNLELQKEIQAHDYAVYHVLAHANKLYTASIDSTIRVWTLDTLELSHTLTAHEDAVKRVVTNGSRLFTGDDKGDVIMWKLDTLEPENIFETVEEVWDLHVRDNNFFSVRDRGVYVTEFKEGQKLYSITKSMQGRAPMYVSSNYVVFTEFGSGFGIIVHQYKPKEFPAVCTMKGHERIVTCMSGALHGNSEKLVTSGYDNKVFLWDIAEGKLLNTCSVASTPSTVSMDTDGSVFVGGSDGYLAKLVIA